MLYALTYQLDGVTGHNGALGCSRDEMIQHCKEMTAIAIDHLREHALRAEWFDASGSEAALGELLVCADPNEVLSFCGQVNALLQANGLGFIAFAEYGTLFDLVDEQEVLRWCSAGLRARLIDLRTSYFALVQALSEEWSE